MSAGRGMRLVACGAAALVLATAAWHRLAAQSIPIRLGGDATSFPGVEMQLPIQVDMSARMEKLGSIALTLRWNPAVLELLGGMSGDFGDLLSNLDSAAAGVLRLVGVHPAGRGGTFVLGVGRFLARIPDTTTLRLEVTELYAAGTFADLLPDAAPANRLYCTAGGRYGDLNGDQKIDSFDAALVLVHAVGRSIAGQGNPVLGDVDGDGLTGARDALLILSAAVGLDVSAFRVSRVAPSGPCLASVRHSLTVSPGTLTLDLGQRAALLAVAYDSTGLGVAATGVQWSTSDAAVATVDSTGLVTAVAAGVATIRASRADAQSGTATITVARRRVHWVDALAFAAAGDRLGAPERPFRTIQEALDYAQPGDTVRVRTGRYDDGASILKPVVLEGDTAGGKPRPLIAFTGESTRGVRIRTPGRVELHRLRLDTLYAAANIVDADYVDTLVVRHVEFRAPTQYYITLNVDTAQAVLVQRSEFLGSRQYAYYQSSGIWVDSAAVVSIDSTLITDYGYYGVYLAGVDSLFVRGSTIRHNYVYGIYACTPCAGTGRMVAAVFTRNRFTQNGSGHVYLNQVRSARYDHNVMVGGGYDGVILYGDTATTLVSFLADSFTTRGGGWINLSNFDSLAVDSLTALVQDGYSYVRGGRVSSIRQSRFLEITGRAIDVNASPRDSTRLILRNVEFRGPDSSSCIRCGYGVEASEASIDADTVTLVNLYYGFSLSNAGIDLRNSNLRLYYFGIYVSCYAAQARVENVSFADGTYGIYNYGGCVPGDSLVVANSTFRRHSSYGIYNRYSDAVINNSVFEDNDSYGCCSYGVYHSYGSLRLSDVSTANGYYGVYAYGDATDSVTVNRSSFSSHQYGLLTYYMPATLTNSTFTETTYSSAQLYYAPVRATDNQLIRPRGSYGIYTYGNAAGQSVRLERNSMTCDAAGAGSVEAVFMQHFGVANPDSAVVLDHTVSGCYSGINVWNTNFSRVEIRGNMVSLPASGQDGIVGWADTLLRIVGNTVSGQGQYGSIVVYSARRADVDSNTVTGGIEAGIYTQGGYRVDTLHIRDNTVSNLGVGTCCLGGRRGAIVLDGSNAAHVRAHVVRNRITDSRSHGIVLLRDFGDTVTVLVDSNTVKRADTLGIWVYGYSRAHIRKNAVDSAGTDAVRLQQFSGIPAALVNVNNFTRSVRKAVNNIGSAGVIDATNNWWGSTLGPRCATGCDAAGGDSVSANVTFDPFLTEPTDAPTPAPPPPMVAARASAPAPAPAAAPARGPAAVLSRPAAWRAPSPPPPEREWPAPAWTALPLEVPVAPHGLAVEDPELQRILAAIRVHVERRTAELTLLRRRWEEREAVRAERERRRAAEEQARAQRAPTPQVDDRPERRPR